MESTILIIDDDEKLNQLLIDYLKDFGFKAIAAIHPADGLQKLQSESPDLIILDVMLPDMNGFEVCKTIRRSHAVPIIMLTARGELTDRVAGLELGADDYLPKPFEPRELVARIQTVLRRSRQSLPEDIRRFAELDINTTRQIARLDGQTIDLTTNEFIALALLTSHPGKVFDRDEILQALRGIDCDAFNRSVDITMSRLRHKLADDPKSPRFIKTVWGRGYVFIGAENDNAA
ncbi:MAG: response regulator transcription factor [Desulfobacterales bacterium]|nr:response regulator transcription factor [Desulfobacterales bacterium]